MLSAKKPRIQVKKACTNCRKACKKCDEQRPCSRCTAKGLTDCVDYVRKPREKGIVRGPYKKKVSDGAHLFNGDSVNTILTVTQQPMSAPVKRRIPRRKSIVMQTDEKTAINMDSLNLMGNTDVATNLDVFLSQTELCDVDVDELRQLLCVEEDMSLMYSAPPGYYNYHQVDFTSSTSGGYSSAEIPDSLDALDLMSSTHIPINEYYKDFEQYDDHVDYFHYHEDLLQQQQQQQQQQLPQQQLQLEPLHQQQQLLDQFQFQKIY
ncbi:hypothetical protein MP228_009072 [Amoeboaphelidium protococcarum]|nr:hypothetical protein MP228_009072 [Amoeboaphelidium protococcarum]